jgi:UDP-N-acetylglucosamine 2-epimerase
LKPGAATILTVVGARPQFVKAAALSAALRCRWREYLLHTGQHYDPGMSASFFSELALPAPATNLEVAPGPAARQVPAMRRGISAAIRRERPALVLTVGDTNSTLAAALAASECGVPQAHVEAGMRSFVAGMPEEANRIVADHLADLCLAPTPTAMKNLRAEGIGERARFVGDVMLDLCLDAASRLAGRGPARFALEPGGYCLATMHRAENTDVGGRLLGVLEALGRIELPVIFPVHPRTRAAMDRLGAGLPANVVEAPPLAWFETLDLAAHAARVLTDSGGLSREAYFLGTPCVTLRETTEWSETLAGGWNRLAGADPARILDAAGAGPPDPGARDLEAFGGGRAGERIREELGLYLARV